MYCLEISLNGSLLWCAGAENASLLTASLGAFIDNDQPCELHVAGMCDLPDERRAHLSWGNLMSLQVDDELLRIAFVDRDSPTLPTETMTTDDPRYLEEQQLFDEFNAGCMGPEAAPRRQWPNLEIQCAVNDEIKAIASMTEGDEHILCSLLWDQWSPESCRVHVRSFGDLAAPVTSWLTVELMLNDAIEFRIHAR